MKRWLFSGILALLLYGSAELIALAGLALLAARGYRYEPTPVDLGEVHRARLDQLFSKSNVYTQFSPTYGWTLRPNAFLRPFYWTNSQGIRATREYQTRPTGDTIRVAAFGDSFTHGVGVANDSTWAAVAERRLAHVEILNFGVASFGVDQAYLRYLEEGRAFAPDVVLIGFISENVNRHVSQYRPFYMTEGGQPLAKPRFIVRDDELVLIPNPLPSLELYHQLAADPAHELPKLGKYDYFYQRQVHPSRWDFSPLVRLIKLAVAVRRRHRDAPDIDGRYNERSDAFQVTTRLFDRFVKDVRAEGSIPLIVIFPTQGDLRRHATGHPRV